MVSTIDNYLVTTKIGTGASCNCVLANDSEGKIVALKVYYMRTDGEKE